MEKKKKKTNIFYAIKHSIITIPWKVQLCFYGFMLTMLGCVTNFALRYEIYSNIYYLLYFFDFFVFFVFACFITYKIYLRFYNSDFYTGFIIFSEFIVVLLIVYVILWITSIGMDNTDINAFSLENTLVIALLHWGLIVVIYVFFEFFSPIFDKFKKNVHMFLFIDNIAFFTGFLIFTLFSFYMYLISIKINSEVLGIIFPICIYLLYTSWIMVYPLKKYLCIQRFAVKLKDLTINKLVYPDNSLDKLLDNLYNPSLLNCNKNCVIYKPNFLDSSANIKIFKLELSLDDVLIKGFEVVGYTKVTKIQNSLKSDSDIFVVVNLDDIRNYRYLKLKINTFTERGVERIYFNIKFKIYEHIFYIESTNIKNIRKVYFTNKLPNKNIKDLDTYNSLVIKSLPNTPYVGETEVELSNVSKLQANFLYQKGTYGCGKTTKAIINLCNENKQPVIISPWEDNSYGDFLYAIFSKLIKVNRKKYFSHIAKQSDFIFFICFLPILLGFNDILINLLDVGYFKFIKMFDLLFYYHNKIAGIFIILLLDLILFLVMRYLIYPIICHKAIILKKDFNTHYKNGLVEQVINLLKWDQVLVIEDIDRLDVEKIKQVFQDLAHLNKRFMSNEKYRKHCIGIISFDEQLMQKKFKSIGEEFDDYKNKLFLNEAYSIKYYDLSLYKEHLNLYFGDNNFDEYISNINSCQSFREVNVKLNEIADTYKKSMNKT